MARTALTPSYLAATDSAHAETSFCARPSDEPEVSPAPELLRFLAELARAFPGRTITIVHTYADPRRTLKSTSHTQGRALDLRIDDVDCTDIEHFVLPRPRLLARVGCFPNATFFHMDVARSRGIWFDASVGLD